MHKIWETFKNYYLTLGEKFQVDPLIFLGIHIVATPLFIMAVAWIVRNYRNKKPLVLPVITSFLVFNAANIYLVAFGRNIPWYVYAILGTTTIISGYFSYRKINKKLQQA